MAKITTLEEIRRVYTLNDLLDAHEALDIQDQLREIASKEAQKGR